MWNEMQCFHQPGLEDMPARAQDVFPSIDSTWLFLGMSSANREIWFSEDNSYPNKKSNYTLWVQRDKDGNAVPVAYKMLGYNSLFGSHYDKYIVTYHVSNLKLCKIQPFFHSLVLKLRRSCLDPNRQISSTPQRW